MYYGSCCNVSRRQPIGDTRYESAWVAHGAVPMYSTLWSFGQAGGGGMESGNLGEIRRTVVSAAIQGLPRCCTVFGPEG